MFKLFVSLALLLGIPAFAQDTPKSIALTGDSNVASQEISKALQKECSNVTTANDVTKSDYSLEAIKRKSGGSLLGESFDLTLFDRDRKIMGGSSTDSLGKAVKDICHAMRKAVIIVEVVDTTRLTQSTDARGDTSGGVAGTGRVGH